MLSLSAAVSFIALLFYCVLLVVVIRRDFKSRLHLSFALNLFHTFSGTRLFLLSLFVPIELACGDAMGMPFKKDAFDVIICGLATHHMNVPRLLFEMRRVLKLGGALTIADVGGSLRWKLPGVRTLIKIATFFYFLVTENIFRGWTEASALPNVYTAEEWQSSLRESGFTGIRVAELPKSHAWIPSPLLITAKKPNGKG